MSKKTLLSVMDAKRYKELKHIVKTRAQAVWEFAEALYEIQQSKLYKDEYESFQQFLLAEVDYSKQRAYQLIAAFRFREQQKDITDNGGVALVPETVNAATRMQTEQFREAAAPPAPEDNGQASSAPAAPPPPKPVENDTAPVDVEVVENSVSDRMGFPLPKEITEAFNRWHITQRLVKKLAEVKVYIAQAKETGDPLFAHLSNGWLNNMENVIYELKSTMPYAVCPYCQGRNPVQCTNCNHTGWVGKFFYEHAVTTEIREMRYHQIDHLVSTHGTEKLSGGRDSRDSARV